MYLLAILLLDYFRDYNGELLLECEIYEGLVIVGNRQIILASSFGAPPSQKRYLELDLSKNYNSPYQWQLEREIRTIIPK